MMQLDNIMEEFKELVITLNAPKEDYEDLIDSIVDPLELDWMTAKYLKSRALLRRTAYDTI